MKTRYIVTLTNLHGDLSGSWETQLRRWLERLSFLALHYSTQDSTYEGVDAGFTRTYWRGQSQPWRLEPGIHSRLIDFPQQGIEFDDTSVTRHTRGLLSLARANGMPGYPSQQPIVSDLPLLGFLQHQGFATPLLDFSVDFLIALAMACFDERDHDKDGVLIVYRYAHNRASRMKPFPNNYDEYGKFSPVNFPPNHQVNFYNPPYVTPRQRIQRGVFFTGGITESADATVNIPFMDAEKSIKDGFSDHQNVTPGRRNFPIPDKNAAAIVIRRRFKPLLRRWLMGAHLLDETMCIRKPYQVIFTRRCSGIIGAIVRGDQCSARVWWCTDAVIRGRVFGTTAGIRFFCLRNGV